MQVGRAIRMRCKKEGFHKKGTHEFCEAARYWKTDYEGQVTRFLDWKWVIK